MIDKPVLDLLKITEDTPLEIETVDGKSLQIKPMKAGPVDRAKFRKAMEKVIKTHGKTFKNLAK